MQGQHCWEGPRQHSRQRHPPCPQPLPEHRLRSGCRCGKAGSRATEEGKRNNGSQGTAARPALSAHLSAHTWLPGGGRGQGTCPKPQPQRPRSLPPAPPGHHTDSFLSGGYRGRGRRHQLTHPPPAEVPGAGLEGSWAEGSSWKGPCQAQRSVPPGVSTSARLSTSTASLLSAPAESWARPGRGLQAGSRLQSQHR